jgi:hypothetical protein
VANLKLLELRKWCGAVGNMTHHPSANESNFYHKKCRPTVLQMVWQWRIGCISILLSRKNADLVLRKWCGAVRNTTHHPSANESNFYPKKCRSEAVQMVCSSILFMNQICYPEKMRTWSSGNGAGQSGIWPTTLLPMNINFIVKNADLKLCKCCGSRR